MATIKMLDLTTPTPLPGFVFFFYLEKLSASKIAFLNRSFSMLQNAFRSSKRMIFDPAPQRLNSQMIRVHVRCYSAIVSREILSEPTVLHCKRIVAIKWLLRVLKLLRLPHALAPPLYAGTHKKSHKEVPRIVKHILKEHYNLYKKKIAETIVLLPPPRPCKPLRLPPRHRQTESSESKSPRENDHALGTSAIGKEITYSATLVQGPKTPTEPKPINLNQHPLRIRLWKRKFALAHVDHNELHSFRPDPPISTCLETSLFLSSDDDSSN